ncbi:hypothetical protein FACS18949_18130 [Clostridia bacterium]|nr:hypothetical protein FACS189425_05840 [Clostridia bacterium]GHV37778.1 hypothetical protein FACS18949_18130 [Clostridia bacterium]
MSKNGTLKAATVKRSTTYPKETLDKLEQLAASKHITVSELVRTFVDKGMEVDGYRQDAEFLTKLIHDELESQLAPAVNRIVKMQMKTGKISSGLFFAVVRLLLDNMDGAQDYSIEEFFKKYMQMGVDYMQTKDTDVNALLTGGDKLLHAARRMTLKGGNP